MFEYIQNKRTAEILKNLEKSCDTLQKTSAADFQKSWYYQGFLTEKARNERAKTNNQEADERAANRLLAGFLMYAVLGLLQIILFIILIITT